MNLTVEDIVSACGGKLYGGEKYQNKEVSSVVMDSRKVTEGGVFIATVGERADGHSFLKDVYAKGIILAIGTKTPDEITSLYGEWTEKDKGYLLVEDPVAAIQKIAKAYRDKLSIPVIGITGSVGKTSTKEFIAGVLSAKFNVLKTSGNFNNQLGVPLTLLQIRKEHEVAVIEMGISKFGEMRKLSKMVQPDICVMTNIGDCHLENLGDRDGVLRAKSEMFEFMAEDGKVCVNLADEKLATISEVKGRTPYTFGSSGADVYATDVVSKGLWGSDAVLHFSDQNKETVKKVSIPLPGSHMVTNATAAALVGKLLGLSPEEIALGMQNVQAISGRNNLIRLNERTLIDDCYNANPASMKAGLELLSLADNYRVAILGDMFELGENSDELHEKVGETAVKSGVNRLICVGENSRHMYEGALEEQKRSNLPTDILYFETLSDVQKRLSDDFCLLLPKNATVLIKASHGMNFSELLSAIKSMGQESQ